MHTSKVPVIYYTGMLSSLYTAQIHDISVIRTSRVYLYSVCLLYIYCECLAILLALLLYLYVSSRSVSWLCCVSDLITALRLYCVLSVLKHVLCSGSACVNSKDPRSVSIGKPADPCSDSTACFNQSYVSGLWYTTVRVCIIIYVCLGRCNLKTI